MNIAEIKKDEIQEIMDFLGLIEDYGHIFHMDTDLLDEPFNKIIENIKLISKMIDDSWSI